MARHSFIQMSKLPNVKGRISYITSHARQENLYATYRTADNAFWNNLARESRQEFQRSGAEGKCIEARELIIALPEVYTQYEPQQVLEDFTDEFRRRYGVECVSALHHNKRKTNYHIHLIFSERKLLPEPDVKIATRSVFFDETGKRVRTKKEITGEDGQIRKGCTIIKKGEVYESHLFTVKDDRFKREPFLREVKEDYTNLINLHIENPEQHLKVFDKNSVYLPTKKIGKNNPKAEEIAADNATRQEWNRTADMALVSGIEEAKILEIKQTEIHDKVSQSIKSEGWLPNLFRRIVNKAKDILQNLIREYGIPPKPTLDIDMTEFCTIQEQITSLVNVQTVILYVVACSRLEADRFQLCFHPAHYDEGQDEAHNDGNRDPDKGKRLLGQILYIVRLAGSCLCDEVIAKIGEFIKGTRKITVGQLSLYLLADILNARVRKDRNAVAAGGYVPVVVLDADKEQRAVPAFAVAKVAVIINIIGIVPRSFPVQRVSGQHDNVHFLTLAELIKLCHKRRFLVAGEQPRQVLHALIFACEAIRLRCKGGSHYTKAQNKRE